MQPGETWWRMPTIDPLPITQALDGYGERLRAARRGAGFRTQAELADAAGFSRPRYNHWERSNNPPDLESLLTLSYRYGIGADWILWGDHHALSARVLQGVIGLADDPVSREVRAVMLWEAELDLWRRGLAEEPAPPMLRYVRLRPD